MKQALILLLVAGIGAGLHAGNTPELQFRSGKPVSVDGRALQARDNNVIAVTSTKSGLAQSIDFIITIPNELTVNLEDISRGGVAIAIKGKHPLPIKSAVWLPKSRIWHQLEASYLPTDDDGVIKLEFPPYLAQIFAEKTVQCSLRLEDFAPGAAPITLEIDAATTIVATTATATSAADAQHQKAADDLEDTPQVQVDVHYFPGSSAFDKKRDDVSKKWDQSFSQKKTKKITGADKRK